MVAASFSDFLKASTWDVIGEGYDCDGGGGSKGRDCGGGGGGRTANDCLQAGQSIRLPSCSLVIEQRFPHVGQ